MIHRTRKAGIIGISSVMLLAGALPVAAAVPQNATVSDQVYAAADSAKTVNPTDAKISKDQAIELARKYVGISDEYTVDNVSYQAVQEKLPGVFSSWQISFSKKKDDRYIGGLNVTIRADNGKLTQFYRYMNDPELRPAYPPKANFSDAKKNAESFIAALYPEEFKNTRYNTTVEENFKTPLNGDVRYPFRYDRVVNGIPYANNAFNVSVDGNGDVVEFSVYWEENAKFADPSKAIDKEKALALWKEQSQVNPAYVRPYENRGGKDFTIRVAYQLQPVTLDAVTGKVWPAGMQVKKESSPLSDKPLAEAPATDKAVAQEEAVSAVTNVFQLPEGAKLENVSYNEYNGSPFMESGGYWNMNWNVPNDKSKDEASAKFLPPNTYIYASVSATTGQIRNYNVSSYYPNNTVEDKDEKVSIADAKAKATELVKKLEPSKAHQLVLSYVDTSAIPAEQRKYVTAHTFTFQRVIDGVQANGENVFVSIDRKTGQLTNFADNLTSLSYPDKKPELLDAGKALDTWLGQYNLELQYASPNSYGGGFYPYDAMAMSKEMYGMGMPMPYPYGQGNTGNESNILIYVPVPKSQSVYDLYLDASTGEWRNLSTGNKAVLGKVKATDTEGHWAGRELNLMVEYNALELNDGKVNPDQVTTRGEMIKMLLTAMNGGYFNPYYDSNRAASFADVKAGSSLFGYVENAVDRNLIDRNPDGNFNPDQPMTREEMAELIVRALGYQDLAKRDGLFNLNVSDAGSIHFKGHVALVLNLGIMTAADGSFQPSHEVTRAEAAVAFFRYLQARSEVSPKPYYY